MTSEDQTILRLPNELADIMREKIETGKVDGVQWKVEKNGDDKSGELVCLK